MSLTHTLPDQDIEVSLLIQRAVSSPWHVARRRYTGQAGEVTIVAARVVLDAIYGPVAAEGSVVRNMSHELTKNDLQGEFSGINARMTGPGLPDEDEWDPEAPDDGPPPRRVVLPDRQQDRRIISTSTRKLLPFSPNWSTRVSCACHRVPGQPGRRCTPLRLHLGTAPRSRFHRAPAGLPPAAVGGDAP